VLSKPQPSIGQGQLHCIPLVLSKQSSVEPYAMPCVHFPNRPPILTDLPIQSAGPVTPSQLSDVFRAAFSSFSSFLSYLTGPVSRTLLPTPLATDPKSRIPLDFGIHSSLHYFTLLSWSSTFLPRPHSPCNDLSTFSPMPITYVPRHT
jgi:hypothetical protein